MNKSIEQNNIQIAIYSRVSSEEQKDGKTIDSQINELKKHAQENGYIIVKEYKDDGWSGGLLARPALDELRDDASKGLFEAVLINDVDRLARDVALMGVVKRDLENKGVKVIFRKLPNGDSPIDNLMINMLGSFAEFERAMIADRFRRGKKYKSEVKKLIVGHTPPYGFNYIKRDKEKNIEGRYEIYEREARIVKKMFELIDVKHLTAHDIARWLLENKIVTRKGSKKWSISSICRILRRTDYIGMAYYYKLQAVEPSNPRSEIKYRRQKKSSRRLRDKSEWVLIPIPDCKIIEEDRFYRVQEILNKNKVFSKRNSKNQYLLSGLIYCACGSRYAGEPQHGKPFYRCRNRINNFPLPKTCHNGSILGETLDDAVWNEVSKSIQNPTLLRQQVENLKGYYKDRPSKLESEIKTLENHIQATEKEENRLFEAYKAGLITISKYKDELELVRIRSVQLKKELLDLHPNNAISKQLLRKSLVYYSKTLKHSLKFIESNFEEKKEFLRNIIKRGIINNRKLELNCALAMINEPKLGIVSQQLRDYRHNPNKNISSIVSPTS